MAFSKFWVFKVSFIVYGIHLTWIDFCYAILVPRTISRWVIEYGGSTEMTWKDYFMLFIAIESETHDIVIILSMGWIFYGTLRNNCKVVDFSIMNSSSSYDTFSAIIHVFFLLYLKEDDL